MTDFDLQDKQALKEEIIKKIDDLEIDFRKEIESLRDQFASKLQEFNQKNPVADIDELSNFAYGIINACSDKILKKMEKRELEEKPIAQEVP